MKKYLLCKKDFVDNNGDTIFFKDNVYSYIEKFNSENPYLFIYYNKKSKDKLKRGRRMYFKNWNYNRPASLIYDYFYTKIEERKIKMKKLNNV